MGTFANSKDPNEISHMPHFIRVCTVCIWSISSGSALFAKFCLFVWFDSLRPINNLSVKQGRVFLG